MSVTYKIAEDLTPDEDKFNIEEWHRQNEEYFGDDPKHADWTEYQMYVKAYKDDDPVGVLEIHWELGVAEIYEIIVKKPHRKQGIAKKMMLKAEDYLKQKGVHKITLETRRVWPAFKMYESLGYKPIVDRDNMYGGVSFVIMDKELT